MTSGFTGVSGLADRYAAALFELAEQDKALDQTAGELQTLGALIEASDDLRRLIRSPVLSRHDQQQAMAAILDRTGASELVRRFVGLVVTKRRLFGLPHMIRRFLVRLARARGETTAVVTSAKPLTKAQAASLSAALKKTVGTDVTLIARVDPDLLGGLVVQVGSRMVDSSLRTKLNRLRIALKGVD